MDLHEISVQLQAGKAKIVKGLVQQAIDEGVPSQEILEKGLLDGMNVIGEKFKNNEVFVPEVLIAARAMNQGVALLKPLLAEAGVKASGKVCIGTVQGDLHDIGKNLVKLMPRHGRRAGNLCADGDRPELPDHLLLRAADHHDGRHGRRRQGGRVGGHPRQGQDHDRRRAGEPGVLRPDRRRRLHLRRRERCGSGGRTLRLRRGDAADEYS